MVVYEYGTSEQLIGVPSLINFTDPRSKKKRNARMKDALEEALILSYS
jgi:hypothetical protein